MKEIGKYCVISLLYVSLFVMLLADVAVGQANIEDVRHRFTGEKFRIVFDLDDNTVYTVAPDWLNKSVTVDLPNVGHSSLDRFGAENWNNFIIGNADLKSTGKGVRLTMKTRNDFTLKYEMLSDGNRLYFDVYPLFGELDQKTLLIRAIEYESRGEHDSAAKMYRSAHDNDPNDTEVTFKLGNILALSGDPEAEDLLKAIPKKSKYFAQSRELLKSFSEPVKPVQNKAATSVAADKAEEKSKDNTLIDLTSNNQLNGDMNGVQDEKKPEIKKIISDNQSADDQKEQIKEQIKNAQSIMNFEQFLKESGAEKMIIYMLYGILFVLAFVVYYLTRKLIRTYKAPKKKKKGSRIDPEANGRLPVRRHTSRKAGFVPEQQINEVRNFAKKLTEIYNRTEVEKPAVHTKKQTRAQPVVKKTGQKIENHTKRIEEVFNENAGSAPFDSEALRLIRRYKENNVESQKTPDNYDVVRQLAAQGWEVWEIARELSMGTEEVKMALRSEDILPSDDAEENIYAEIFRLADLDLSTFDIAKRLKLDEEQIRLALKMRKDDIVIR
ncbi:tetratricopeptide repeat protein [candidate division KSB1 bacterium]